MKKKLARSLNAVKKFYFLEYFYILLKSVEKYSNRDKIFNSFKELKHKHRLGESKYRKLTLETEELTKVQLDRYKYTFGQIIDEAKQYELIEVKRNVIELTPLGLQLNQLYESKG